MEFSTVVKKIKGAIADHEALSGSSLRTVKASDDLAVMIATHLEGVTVEANK